MVKKLCFGFLVCSLMVVILADCGTEQGATPTGTPTPTVQATATTSGTASATPTPSPGPSQPINEIWMSDATTGWASTTTHLILHTIDEGKSWQDVTPPYPADSTAPVPPAFAFLNNISRLAFVSAQEGWAISTPTSAAPVLLKTMDGGHTWVQVS